MGGAGGGEWRGVQVWSRPDLPERRSEKDRAMGSNKGEELKGRGKEAVGDLTGDKDLQREGQADQASAKVKDKVSKAVDGVKDAVTKDAR
jgi:uncharacterized protein YjbJ (UPF0337 family)